MSVGGSGADIFGVSLWYLCEIIKKSALMNVSTSKWP